MNRLQCRLLGEIVQYDQLIRERLAYEETLAHFQKLQLLITDPVLAGKGWHLEGGDTLVIDGYLPAWKGGAYSDAAPIRHDPQSAVHGYVSRAPWQHLASLIRYVEFLPGAQAITLQGAFANCMQLKQVSGWRNLKTMATTDMSFMFYGCTSLREVDLTHLRPPRVRSMMMLFATCRNLQRVTLPDQTCESLEFARGLFKDCWLLTDVSFRWRGLYRLEDVSSFFMRCLSLESFEPSWLCGSPLKRMDLMFDSCVSIREIRMPGLDTSRVTDMSFLFHGCTSLELVDLTGWDTSAMASMLGMFASCPSLHYLDLSSFDTRQVEHMELMLTGISEKCKVSLGPHTVIWPER